MFMYWKANIVKMLILPKLIYRLNRISIKTFIGFLFFFRNQQNDSKIQMERQNNYKIQT